MTFTKDDLALLVNAINYAEDTLVYYIEEVLPDMDDRTKSAKEEYKRLCDLRERIEEYIERKPNNDP